MIDLNTDFFWHGTVRRTPAGRNVAVKRDDIGRAPTVGVREIVGQPTGCTIWAAAGWGSELRVGVERGNSAFQVPRHPGEHEIAALRCARAISVSIPFPGIVRLIPHFPILDRSRPHMLDQGGNEIHESLVAPCPIAR